MTSKYLRKTFACAGVLSALFLTSCAAVPVPVASKPQLACDYLGTSGICIRFDHDAKTVDPIALEADYLKVRDEVEARYGLNLKNTPGPVVRVVSFATFSTTRQVYARMDGDKGGTHGWTDFSNGQITLTGPAIMRHETFHYLLWRSGYPNALNSAHEHAAFDEYRDGRWLPKRVTASN